MCYLFCSIQIILIIIIRRGMGGRSMNRLFRDILRENKNDYIRTVLGCSWIISLIYFSTAVGGCLSYISTGSIPQMTYLIMEVEKEFLIPYGLLLILLILLLSGYIRKRAVIYKTLTVFGMKRKHKYRFIFVRISGNCWIQYDIRNRIRNL